MLLENLPEDVTEDAIKEFLGSFEVSVVDIREAQDGRRSASVTLTSHRFAKQAADALNRKVFRESRVKVSQIDISDIGEWFVKASAYFFDDLP